MPLLALVFALAAACFHALWNLLLARARDVESATVVALLTAEIVFAPVAVAVWRADARVIPWIVGSGLLELAYFALLAAAYRKAPLSVVYPIARGGAPVLVLVLSVAALGAATSARQVLGVVVVVMGVLLVRGLARADAAGLAFGVAIACCIAGYTLVDKHGIAHAGPIPYLELVMILPAAAYATAVARVKGADAIRAAVGVPTVVAGLATFVAYAFVLAALERAPAAPVAAVRETSVVIAAALAVPVLNERVTRRRFLGACVVAGGIALLAA
jgi:drug/metabolite transporter (DMT)-like permease